jgi:hypothetical protein
MSKFMSIVTTLALLAMGALPMIALSTAQAGVL